MELDFFLSILKKYEEKIHDMLSLMLDPRFKYFVLDILQFLISKFIQSKIHLGKWEKKF